MFDDEGNIIVCDGVDKGVDFKDENGDEVNLFDGKKGVEMVKEELESGGGEEVGWWENYRLVWLLCERGKLGKGENNILLVY